MWFTRMAGNGGKGRLFLLMRPSQMKVLWEEENKSPGTAGAFICTLLQPLSAYLLQCEGCSVQGRNKAHRKKPWRQAFKNGLTVRFFQAKGSTCWWEMWIILRKCQKPEVCSYLIGLLSCYIWNDRILGYLLPVYLFIFSHSQLWRHMCMAKIWLRNWLCCVSPPVWMPYCALFCACAALGTIGSRLVPGVSSNKHQLYHHVWNIPNSMNCVQLAFLFEKWCCSLCTVS